MSRSNKLVSSLQPLSLEAITKVLSKQRSTNDMETVLEKRKRELLTKFNILCPLEPQDSRQ